MSYSQYITQGGIQDVKSVLLSVTFNNLVKVVSSRFAHYKGTFSPTIISKYFAGTYLDTM